MIEHPALMQLVMFHGCYHDASGSWPYDPTNCPECLGLPEEVAHVKQVGAAGADAPAAAACGWLKRNSWLANGWLATRKFRLCLLPPAAGAEAWLGRAGCGV